MLDGGRRRGDVNRLGDLTEGRFGAPWAVELRVLTLCRYHPAGRLPRRVPRNSPGMP
jgi:hypothetical protein